MLPVDPGYRMTLADETGRRELVEAMGRSTSRLDVHEPVRDLWRHSYARSSGAVRRCHGLAL